MENGALTSTKAFGQAPAASTFTVRGRVIFSDNLPASNMEVTLSRDAQNWVVGPVVTDRDGFFRIDHLSSGRYFVNAYGLGQGGHTWGQTPVTNGSFQASLVTVGPEDPVGDVTFRIDRPAKVYGTIRDQSGDPATIAVYALRRAWAFGRPYLSNANQGGSDDTGNFRLRDIPKGRYRFCAVSNRTLPPTGNANFNSPSSHLAVADCPSDGPFTEIRAGEVRRIDLRTRVVTGLPVRVLTNGKPTPEQIEFLPKYGLNETRVLFGANLSANRYQIGLVPYYSIPVGRYVLRTTSFQGTVSGMTEISVTPNGPNVFDLPLGAAPIVNIEVTVPPGYDKSAVRIGLHDASDPGAAVLDSNNQLTYGAPTNPSIINVQYPGRYWLVTRSELCPSSARAGNLNLLAQPLTLVAGQTATIAVKFEKTCATIGGQVKFGANLVPRARVAILMSGTPQNPGDVLLDSADEHGKFIFTGMTPRSYWLWAWTQDDEESGKVESLGEIAAQGRILRLASGETKSVDLRLLQIPQRSAK